MFLCLYQRTPLDVAVERGYINIAEFFREDNSSEVSVRYNTLAVVNSTGVLNCINLTPSPSVRQYCTNCLLNCIKNLHRLRKTLEIVHGGEGAHYNMHSTQQLGGSKGMPPLLSPPKNEMLCDRF